MLGEQLINGLTLGFIYALIALGYTMVYGIVKLINFAHGDMLMVGAYSGYFVLKSAGTSPQALIIAMLISMTVCAVLGVTIERVCYKPLRSAPRINALIVAIGASLFLENIARVIPFIGPNPRQYIQLPKQFLHFFDLQISITDVIVILVSIFLMIVLALIVKYTRTGKAMRAVSFDNRAASLMGINVNVIISATFALGSALAATAGILYAIKYPSIDPLMGFMPGIKAFVAAVLGGIGSIPGAALGGIILGLSETLAKAYISTKLSDAIVFGILILILLVKPTGLLGKNIKEKV